MPKRSRKVKPSGEDLRQIAFRIVQESTGTLADLGGKNPAAVALGRLGGLKGGPARKKALSPKRRKEIARKAAESRWKSKP